MSHRLIVLPDDTADAILAPINAARHTMNIRMFLFTDPSLINAVIAAERRGVKVRVMLNPARRDGTSDNDAAREMLKEAGIAVRDSSAEFAVTHQKSMVIDDKVGFIESLNWETRDLTETRDYAVETTSKTEVAEMVRCFNADWDGQPFEPAAESELIWCPNNGRQRYQDMVIIERLVRAVNRGVRVRIMARALHKLKRKKLFEGVSGLRIVHDVGAKVRTLRDLKLHGKIMIADDERAIVGSINLSPGSFDDRRELAVETSSKHVVRRLVETAHHDWKRSRKLPLSDEAVLADLEGHGIKDVSRLALVSEGAHEQHP
jgi:cardiolipin synthase